MLRRESDREDLLKEAVAFVRRVELLVSNDSETTFIGFRSDGSGAIYFGQDFVVQFNTRLELRRGYFRGSLLKADRGKLIEIRRNRDSRTVYLESRALSADESREFLAHLRSGIERLRQALDGNAFALVGQVPADDDIMPHVRTWLNELPEPLPIAQLPRSG